MQTLISTPAKTAYPDPPAYATAPRLARRAQESSRAVAWWLWPHLLSLDAPVVAVVWQRYWARVAHIRIPWSETGVLALGVWLIYLADRLVDAARAVPGDTAAARHVFHDQRRRALTVLAGAVSVVLVIAAPGVLPRRELLPGLCLLAMALVYFWLIHGRRQFGWTNRVPKEAVVGAMFALGTAFFPWCRGGMAQFQSAASAGLFGALCFCNCALITAWERHGRDLRDPSSLLNAFPKLTARLPMLCGAVSALAAVGLFSSWAGPWLPLAVSGVLLVALDRAQTRLSPSALRVLADAALLTPLLCDPGLSW